MCGSTLSYPLDFFEFAFFTMLIISSEYVGVQKKVDAFSLEIVLGHYLFVLSLH